MKRCSQRQRPRAAEIRNRRGVPHCRPIFLRVASSGAHTGNWLSSPPSSTWSSGVTSVALCPGGVTESGSTADLSDQLRQRPRSIETQDGAGQPREPCLMSGETGTLAIAGFVMRSPLDELFRFRVAPAAGSHRVDAEVRGLAGTQALQAYLARGHEEDHEIEIRNQRVAPAPRAIHSTPSQRAAQRLRASAANARRRRGWFDRAGPSAAKSNRRRHDVAPQARRPMRGRAWWRRSPKRP